MTEKFIILLKDQIDRLDSEEFDLEAWKASTVLYLARIFGDTSPKIDQIEKIRFEQGSWALRDASGHSDMLISCKRRGKAILEACIHELEVLGIDEDRVTRSEGNPVAEGMNEELKVSQLKEIKKILANKSSRDEKIDMINKKLLSFGYDISPRIIAQIITHPKNKNIL